MNKNLVPSMIKFMSIIGNNKKFNGEQKKEWVLLKLKEEMPYDDKLEDVIIEMIDYLILVDNNSISINPVVKKGCLKCFGY